MNKTVMNLAIVSCFAFGLSVAHAASHEKKASHDNNDNLVLAADAQIAVPWVDGHADEHSSGGHADAQSPDGHAHATKSGPYLSDPYFKKANISGQTQNVQIDDKGIRIPYNMAQDLPSVSQRENGVRTTHGHPNPFLVVRNEAKPVVESNKYWCMIGTNNPSGSCFNAYPTSSGRNFYQAR